MKVPQRAIEVIHGAPPPTRASGARRLVATHDDVRTWHRPSRGPRSADVAQHRGRSGEVGGKDAEHKNTGRRIACVAANRSPESVRRGVVGDAVDLDRESHAPAGVTAIMVGATKIGVLIAMFLSLSALPGNVAVPANLGIIVIFFAVLTMTAGNLLALNQPDLRYILGYSSVAQMGYILLGFGIGMVYNLQLGFIAGLYYAIAYSLMKAGAFLAADAFAFSAGSFETAKMNGQGARHPLLGISMVIFIFGLSGVPFTCGFLGKLLLEQAGMVTSMISGVILALVLALNSAISLGYYVPVMSTLIFPDKKSQTGTIPANIKKIPVTLISGIVILAIITVYFGLFPESFEWISHAGGQLYSWGVR